MSMFSMKQKLYNFICIGFFIIKYIYVYIKLSATKIKIKLIKSNWYLSRNRNFYNPSLAATVYRYGNIWKIARYNNYFGAFENKDEAMASIFQDWIEENRIDETIIALQNSLQDIKESILSIYNNHQCPNDRESFKDKNYRIIEKFENNVNFMAKYFYLAQTHKSCYRCKESTLVNAIILPEGFEAIDEFTIEDLEEAGVDLRNKLVFCNNDYLSILSYVTYISPEALWQIHKYVDEDFWKKKYSFSTHHSYYRSICHFCGSAQGDNFVISEYNSAFYPSKIEDFEKIKFYRIDEEIKAYAGGNSIGYGYSSYGLISVTNIYKTQDNCIADNR